MEGAIIREIKEELGCGVKDVKFVTAKEELFTYEGEKRHEANFLYKVELDNEELFEKDIILNPDSDEFPAVWISISDVLSEEVILYPSFDYKIILT
jgi:8-oxo-dGTP pyrophosphatase MutT (NUDIX family)